MIADKPTRNEDSILISMQEHPEVVEHIEFLENRVLEMFVSPEKGMTLLLGCLTPHFTEALAQKMTQGSRLIVVDPSGPMIDSTRLRLGTKGEGKVFFKSDLDWTRLPFDDGVFQSLISVLLWEIAPNRLRLLQEMSRVVAPGGKALLGAYLCDSMKEFFDIYSEVINKFDLIHLTQPLQKIRNMLLSRDDYEALANECGLKVAEVSVYPCKILFGTAKDLFASPFTQVYWLPLWEKVAGKESERTFWHIRQFMDNYWSGRKIPLTLCTGLLVATR